MAIFVGGCSRADDEPAERIGILTRLTVRCGMEKLDVEMNNDTCVRRFNSKHFKRFE